MRRRERRFAMLLPFEILICLLLAAAMASAQSARENAASNDATSKIPTVRFANGVGQILVHGKPFLILGGELGNSSSGTAAQADEILPKLAKMHFNTVLAPVAWAEIEPTEGHFDFSILDHWIDVARQHDMHIVILWFGSWKNAFSEYTPEWVKVDTTRFPRAISAEGLPTEILSTFGSETMRCDSRAFAALMRHVREKDAERQTVLMVQVENEMGFLGRGGRDRSAAANQAFENPVPATLVQSLKKNRLKMAPELAANFNPEGRTWKEMFGAPADEAFMAWHYGIYVNQVMEAGKKEYALPMYMNAQLPAPGERPGDYPSGGPNPYNLDIYRAGAPAADFYAPDIYWPNFDYWVQRYKAAGNPAFIPEARLESGAANALYAYGEGLAFGFSPFDVDSLPLVENKPEAHPTMGDVYGTLSKLSNEILQAQQEHKIRGLALHVSSLRPRQTVSLGGYLFQATLSRSWASNALATNDGAMMILQTGANEFYVVGNGLSVTFFRDPDIDDQVAGIAGIERLSSNNGTWQVVGELNGDQSDQGRRLLMAAHEMNVYRVKLYSYKRDPAAR